jgi:hypothetical protein
LTSIRRGVKNAKHGLGHILAAAACLVAATAPPPAIAQQVVPDVFSYVYTLRPILFPVPNTALLETRRKDADALRARFADCESGLPDARAQYNVIIGKQITKDPADLPSALRDVLDKTGLGHLTPPETTWRGVELFAFCGAGPPPPNASLPEPSPPSSLKNRHLLFGRIPNVWQEIRPVALVVPDFGAADTQLRQTATDMARFIGSALHRSCHYKLINNDDIGHKVLSIDDVKPDFSYWRSIKSDIVVEGRLTELSSGQLRVEVRMWDVWSAFLRVPIYAHSFAGPPDKVQHISYAVAGDMYERLCGDDGYVRMPP